MIVNLQTEQEINVFFKEMERKEIREKNHISDGKWKFDWQKPFTQGFEVYGLMTEEYPEIIQGLIALKPNFDEDYLCVDIDILESAPHNKKNEWKTTEFKSYIFRCRKMPGCFCLPIQFR